MNNPIIRFSSPVSQLFFPILLILLLFGCSNEPIPEEKTVVATPVVEKQKPAHYIICIDNSRSIKWQEQVIIRESTMILADLAEEGDRISVITFGKDARLIASAHIKSDQDRIFFKNQVRKGVTFKENFSDIRAAVKFLLPENTDSPLRFTDTDSHVIFLSDGKLETADRQTRKAYNEMNEILDLQLAGIHTYAVVLGNTYCNDRILPPDVTGITVMKDHIARRFPDHYFHAESLDQLLTIAVNILSKTKQITSLGEKRDASQFKIDDSVESMTLIVRKKSTDGTTICDSSDIILHKPEQQSDSSNEAIYRSSDYKYIDLIVVRNPRQGIWSISLKNGSHPEILSKIITPLGLRFSSRRVYYLNELSTLSAWIFNKQTSRIEAGQSFKIHAHLSLDKNFTESNVYVDLHPAQQTGQYFLEVPSNILSPLNSVEKPATVNMELIAQRYQPDSTELDKWFIRRTSPVVLKFVESFVDWTEVDALKYKIPFMEVACLFSASLRPDHPSYPDFEVPPKLMCVLERFDPETEAYIPVEKNELSGDTGRIDVILATPGIYRYIYHLSGNTQLGGPLIIKSPHYYFEIKSLIIPICIGIAVCFVICLYLFSSLLARIKGRITIEQNEMASKSVNLNHKKFDSPTENNKFSLKARRLFFVKNAIVLTVTRGRVKVKGKTIKTGQQIELLPRREHTITLDEEGSEIRMRLKANI